MSIGQMISSFHLPLLVTIIKLYSAHAHLSNETDRESLLMFKSQIQEDPYKALDFSWNHSSHFCRWHGIICSRRHQRVVGMNLSYLDLGGRISPHLGNLSFLQFIYLPNNSFRGDIPQEIGRLTRLRRLDFGYNSLEGGIPATLSNCSRLRLISLAHNKLGGDVPAELGLLFELGRLALGGNSFTGAFPPFLTNLSSLTSLSLVTNNFHGPISDGIGKLSGLEILNLGGNSFTGELPPSIYNLSNIVGFGVAKNQLSGSLSPDMGYFFPRVQLLIMFSNNFTGKVPITLCNSSHLLNLGFSENNFVGSMPIGVEKLRDLVWFDFGENQLGEDKGDDLLFLNSLSNCSKLEAATVASNKLSGTLPPTVANLSTSLRHLLLGFNLIHGRIPSGFGSIPGLQRLVLAGNLLTGPIPDELGKLPNLGGLYLNGNSLSGQVPISLGNLSHLVDLALWQNQLQGKIPSSIGNCTRLEYLLLFNNSLSGSIPGQVFNLRQLVFLDLSHNSFNGNLPDEVGRLQNLNSFDISHNRLFGEIPTSLGNCKSLVSLNFSHNLFTGVIPKSFQELSAVETVDLSSNSLTGMIPTYLTKFNAIQILNFSFNNLSGEVPLQGPFRNASKIFVLGNDKLCGGILELSLPPCPKMDVKRGHKTILFLLKIILPLAAGFIIFLAIAVQYYRWRKQNGNKLTLSSSMKRQHMQISYSELHRATNGFSATNLLGSGSFGSVYRGASDLYQINIAVKVINKIEHTSLQGFISECEALKRIRHRNVVRILTSCVSLDFQGNEFKALVFKFMKNGSLDSWLHPSSGQDLYLSFSERLDVAIDVANALDYLHNHCETPIIHCDLKPSNIMLDEDMVAQVSDFGLAKVLLNADVDSSCSSMLKGSIGYIPPEYGAQHKVTPQGDVYSYGVLVLEMFMAKRPTDEMFKDGINISKHVAYCKQHERLMEIVDQRMLQIENIEDDHLFENCFSSIMELGIACTAELPHKRKNVSEVCAELQAARVAYQRGVMHR